MSGSNGQGSWGVYQVRALPSLSSFNTPSHLWVRLLSLGGNPGAKRLGNLSTAMEPVGSAAGGLYAGSPTPEFVVRLQDHSTTLPHMRYE